MTSRIWSHEWSAVIVEIANELPDVIRFATAMNRP